MPDFDFGQFMGMAAKALSTIQQSPGPPQSGPEHVRHVTFEDLHGVFQRLSDLEEFKAKWEPFLEVIEPLLKGQVPTS